MILLSVIIAILGGSLAFGVGWLMVRPDGVIALFADDVPGAQPVCFLKRRASQGRKQSPGK